MNADFALVTFVKTPGVSPVKTRLARDIGQDLASEFYALSLKATEARAHELKKLLPSLTIYWAVAEESCLEASVWSQFPSVPQGEGDLGDRLARVYEESLRRHSLVCFMGADSPHITSSKIANHIKHSYVSRERHFHLGPTSDGGFFFFGSGIPVAPSLWRSIQYSTDRTASDLEMALLPTATTIRFDEDFDIDEKSDLERLSKIDRSDPGLLPEQLAIIDWASALISSTL